MYEVFKDRRFYFEPKYKFKNFMFKDEETKNFLKDRCFGDGKYCVGDDSPLSPDIVLSQAIWQKCTFNVSKDHNQLDIWWNYINNYTYCIAEHIKDNADFNRCTMEVWDYQNIDLNIQSDIENCFTNSFIDKNNIFESDNSILEQDSETNSEYSGLYLIPSFFINGELLREEFDFEIIGSALCDQLIEEVDYCMNMYYYVENDYWPVADDSVILPEKRVYYGDRNKTETEQPIEEPEIEIDLPRSPTEEEPEISVCDGPPKENREFFKHRPCSLLMIIFFFIAGFVTIECATL